MTILPDATNKLHGWIWPEDIVDYGIPLLIIVLGAKAGWSFIDHIFPSRRKNRDHIEVIQESGPGGVQESD